jgi:hypothetical protein
VPKEAEMKMGLIASRYEGNRSGAARTILDQRRQLEPYKVPEAVSVALESMKKGNQVVVFADRINESTVYQVDGEGKDRPKLMSSEGTIRLIRDQLIAAGVSSDDIVELHGNADLPAPEAMSQFQSGNKKVILTTAQSGGTGINLDDVIGNAPRTLISMTPNFSANDFMQMVGRVWRSQTASIPEIFCLFSQLEIDKWGKDLLASKLAILGATVGGAPRDFQKLSFAERLALYRRRNRFNPFMAIA